MDDALILGGSGCIIIGCFFIAPALALVALGLLLLAIGVVRLRQRNKPTVAPTGGGFYERAQFKNDIEGP